jgi:N-acetylated-alpha-linked acidic dipeptidase
MGYGGEGETAGVYHSVYDSFDHYARFADPTFDYAIALSKTAGRAILRFANADYLPLTFGNFSDTVSVYVKEVMKLATDEKDSIAERNRRINERTFEAADDPTKALAVPKAENPAPFLNFAPLQNALLKLEESCRRFDNAMKDVNATNLRARDVQQSLDNALRQVEFAMITDAGLPRRPWFRHQIYAPGFYTGYGVKTLPGIREAIEQHNWTEASEQIIIVANTLERVAVQIDRARDVIR